MSLSVKYDGTDLGTFLHVLDGYTIHGGANWEPSYNEVQGKSAADFTKTKYKIKKISMPFAMKNNLNEKYDLLQKILNVDAPKELILGNIPDKYFMAVPEGDLDFEEINKNGGKGKIKWLVCDGLAHSLTKKEFHAIKNVDGILEATIVNDGSAAVPIDYEIEHNHENGYIGIVSQYGAIELGRIDEEDDATANKSVTLINFTKYADFDAMTTGEGITSETTYGKTGTFKEISYNGRSWLSLSSLGSGNYYKGACKKITIPDLTFRKDNVLYTYDIPNRYSEGCVVKVDGESTKVYVNDVESPGDEVLGSKYFLAPPGETKVRFYYSEFSTPAPTIKAYIREAYL